MSEPVQIRVLRETGFDPDVPLPAYATAGAAGADLRANLPDGDMVLNPGERVLITTGLRLEIPEGYEIQIRPRSGLALKHGITLPNSPGTIDSDYRGLLGVIMKNASKVPYTVEHGERIAQMVVAPVLRACFSETEELTGTERDSGGFGSTGTR